MKLPLTSRKTLMRALIDAFPHADDLEKIAYFLDDNALSSLGERGHEMKVIALIRWAESNDRVEQLLETATEINGENQALRSARNDLALFFQQRHEPISSVPVITGFSALRRLADKPEVKTAIRSSRKNLEDTYRRLRSVRSYKTVHDLLHEIETECYDLIVLELEAETHASYENLDLHRDTYCTYLDQLKDVVLEGILPANEVAFVGAEMQSIADQWGRAILSRDSAGITLVRNKLKIVLGRQQSFINTLLYSSASNMLPSFLASLESISSSLVEVVADSNQFRAALERLSVLNVQLNCLIESHHSWQQLENEMRRIADFLPHIIDELQYSPTFWELPAALAVPPQFAKVKVRYELLKAALDSGDQRQICKAFQQLRKLAGTVFFGLDKSLKAQCEELPHIAIGLNSLLEAA